MTKKKTSSYISMEWLQTNRLLVLLFMLMPTAIFAHNEQSQQLNAIQQTVQTGDSTEVLAPGEKPKPTKYIPTQEDMKQTFFQGFTVSTDLLNMGLYFFSSTGSLEASLRLNLLNTYFPIAEIGLGRCNTKDLKTSIEYSTNAPYFKVGIDYNVLRNKWQSNKLYVGIRYGFTNFNYSFKGDKPQVDPIWHGEGPLAVHGLNATSHYGEFVFGCQVKLWSIVHMGWSARYKYEFHTTKSLYSHPYYIPGYGTTVNGSCWGVTYNLSFDLNWGKKKPTVKQIVENAIKDIKNESDVKNESDIKNKSNGSDDKDEKPEDEESIQTEENNK